MIKTEYIDSSNYEVLSFSLRLLTSIYKTNKNINGIYINYLYIFFLFIDEIRWHRRRLDFLS